MFEYLLYFFITLGFSTLFGVIGLGSSLVLIPLFTLMGVDFNFAKAIGLLVNGVTTLSLSLHNIKNKLFNIKEIFILIVVSSLFALLGAYSSQYIAESLVKILLILFILLSVVLLYAGHIKKEIQEPKSINQLFLVLPMSLIAFTGGLIGVGGGALYLPLLLLIGINTKKSIAVTSAFIPIVSFSGFFAYTSFVEMDWVLLFVVGVAAVIGGFLGSVIMHKIKEDRYLKILIAFLLLMISTYMLIEEIV